MRIIIDIDNTICKTHEYFLQNCKVRFGRHDLFYDKEKLRASDYHLTEWFVNSNLATEVEARAMKEIIFNDIEHSDQEARYICYARSAYHNTLMIAFTIRNKKIRTISARKASKKERNVYESQNKRN